MEPLTLARVCSATTGKLLDGGPNKRVRRVTTDSRDVRDGDLFVCLEGDRFDGHSFAADALAAGAVAVLAARQPAAGCPTVLVDDVLVAFGALGRAVRRRARKHQDPLVVAITGTNGKTGTKDLAAAALASGLETVASRRSFNNSIGVPITLLDIDKQTEAVVVEMGTNHMGEIASLGQLVEPEVAVITNIHAGHLAGLGNLAGVLEEKSSLLAQLKGRKLSVLNRDDAHFARLAERAPGEIISFGTDPAADVLALDVRCAANGTSFRLGDGRAISLRHLGRHSVLNALAALACAQVAGVDPVAAAAALADVPPPPGRLQLRRIGQVTVIDDSYNANPGSLTAAAAALNELGLGGRRVLIVGDMLELGADAGALHRAAGRTLAGCQPALLVTVGRHAADLRDGAVEAGVDPEDVLACDSRRAAANVLAERLIPGDVVLLKGSRLLALEALIGELDAPSAAAASMP